MFKRRMMALIATIIQNINQKKPDLKPHQMNIKTKPADIKVNNNSSDPIFIIALYLRLLYSI